MSYLNISVKGNMYTNVGKTRQYFNGVGRPMFYIQWPKIFLKSEIS